MSPRPTPVVTRREQPEPEAPPAGRGTRRPTDPGRSGVTSPGTRAGRTRLGRSGRRPIRSSVPIIETTGQRTPPPAATAADRRVIGGSQLFRRRFLTWRRTLAALLVLALVAGVVWTVWFSSLLTVKSVQVLGTSRQSPVAVRALLEPEVGRQLARVDLSVAAQRVVNLPAVRSVQVVRAWPNSLEVRVTERVPVAVAAAGGGFTLLDVQGIRMASTAKSPGNLPLLTPATLAAGTGATRAATESLNQLAPALRSRVRTADAKTPDSVTLTLKNGATVKWGSSEDSERKAEVLAVLLSKIKAKTYDVTAPGTPVTK